MVLWKEHIYVGELNGMGGVDEAPGLGHRVTVYDLQGNRVCLFGSAEEGEGPGQFIAPHGIAVDSKGDVYVAEVSFTIRGSKMDPPKVLRSFSKYARQ
jgi:DNA-binding beta-propeller fold protein YncE